jgi:hypothetical protein
MENKNAQLIRKYMNLMESIETKIIIEEKSIDINEDLLASAAREGKLAAAELEGFLKTMKQDSKIGAELTKAGIRDAEELLLALKGNKLSSTLKGSLELNILKSQTTNAKLIDLASENLARNQQFLKKYSNEIKQGQPQFEAALKKGGYSDRAITKIVEKAYLKKSSGLQTVAAKDRELANKQLVGKDRLTDVLSKKPKSFIDKVKNFTETKGAELSELLKSGKNWKKILAWATVLGISAPIIYWAIKGSGKKSPEGFPTTEPTTPEGFPTTEPVTPEVKPSEGIKNSNRRRSVFTDKYEFPYHFGDRSPIIKEVQICFFERKDWHTGNFGKHTLEKLQDLYDTSEINEDIYNTIKNNCKKSSTTNTPTNTPTNTTNTPTNTTNTPTNTTNTPTNTPTNTTKPIENTKPVSDTTTSTTQPQSSPKTESGGELYARLNAAGLLGPRKFQKNVIVYKGEDLSKEDLDKITTYLNSRGFRLSRDNKDKRFGEKIVFKKNKPTEETGNTQDNTDISDL